MRNRLAFLVLLFVLAPFDAHAQTFEVVGRWTQGAGGPAAIDNGVLYHVEGSVLVAADVSNGVPVERSRMLMPGVVRDVQAAEGRLYVVDAEGLRLYEAAGGAPPVQQALYQMAGAEEVRVEEGRAVVWTSQVLHILDVTDPAKPALLKTVHLPRYISDVDIVGDAIYVASTEAGLVVLEVGSSARTSVYLENARSIDVVGDIAYVGAQDRTEGATLHVVDVAARQPRVLHEIDMPGILWSLEAEPGRLVTLGSLPKDVAPVSGWGATIFDVGEGGVPEAVASVPASPTRNGALNGRRLLVDDELLVISDYERLTAVDVSDPAQPVRRWGMDHHADWADDVQVAGGLAFVADRTAGLHVLDVTAPRQPARIATTRLKDDITTVVEVEGERAYTGGWKYLNVVDVADPHTPIVRSTVDIAAMGSNDDPGMVTDLRARGGYLYAAAYGVGLVVFDVSDDTAPAVAGRLDFPGLALDLDVQGNWVAVAAEDAFVMVDASDPSRPQILATVTAFGDGVPRVAGVKLQGDYAYVLDVYQGLYVFDVSVPSSPRRVAAIERPWGPTPKLALDGDHLFIADMVTLNVIDVSDPEAPRVVEGSDHVFGFENPVTDVVIDAGFVYTANGLRGLTVLRNPFTPTSAEPAPDAGRDVLEAAYPNPSSGAVVIPYRLDAAQAVRLSVYDLLGREVARLVDGVQPEGAHQAVFDAHARGLAAGAYLYRLEAGGRVESRRVVVVR